MIDDWRNRPTISSTKIKAFNFEIYDGKLLGFDNAIIF